MTALEPPRKRHPYQKHGLVALQNALKAVDGKDGWLESLGEVGKALQAWKADLVGDLGGEAAVSAQERAVVELAVKTHLLLESVDRWLLQQPSLVNKSRRQLFPVVLQRQQLADALARYMTQLGLRRRARPVPNLEEYLRERYGQGEDRSERSDRSWPEKPREGDGPPRCPSPNSSVGNERVRGQGQEEIETFPPTSSPTPPSSPPQEAEDP